MATLLELLAPEPEGTRILSNVRTVHPMTKPHPERLPKVPSQSAVAMV